MPGHPSIPDRRIPTSTVESLPACLQLCALVAFVPLFPAPPSPSPLPHPPWMPMRRPAGLTLPSFFLFLFGCFVSSRGQRYWPSPCHAAHRKDSLGTRQRREKGTWEAQTSRQAVPPWNHTVHLSPMIDDLPLKTNTPHHHHHTRPIIIITSCSFLRANQPRADLNTHIHTHTQQTHQIR
ncbi:hypothetical protein DFH94DRAFT_490871 [Russula ochroleuca]|jgi:hypothetical protein|uniref:Uncharacterized protein n=1 Tax=Russula ochroleuca TaxID=152965 RepID=A0A9P5MV70_9AGAM|nr:hypothetical protein DFH94DRAFT_490871 [Russula ochroleuca]